MNHHFLRHRAELAATDLHPFGRSATKHLVSALNLSHGQRILEIGCGTGGTLVQIGASRSYLLEGLDLQPAMLQIARRRLFISGLDDRIHVVQASAPALPLASTRYDRVYTESVLGFQSGMDAPAMLSEIFRVLIPGGLYVANEAIWKYSVSSARIATINQACLKDFGTRQASEQPWRLHDWLVLMQSAGFEVRSAELLDPAMLSSASASFNWRMALSDLLTLFYRAMGYLNPRIIGRRRHYRRRLVAHRADGRYIESRLFVLAKPDTPI